jgi:hypothetical protein
MTAGSVHIVVCTGTAYKNLFFVHKIYCIYYGRQKKGRQEGKNMFY